MKNSKRCWVQKLLPALLGASAITFGVQAIANPHEGGNRIPDSFLTLSAHVSIGSSTRVKAMYWDESCFVEDCRVSGYVDGDTKIIGADGSTKNIRTLKAFEKYRVLNVQCTGGGCQSISVIELAQ